MFRFETILPLASRSSMNGTYLVSNSLSQTTLKHTSSKLEAEQHWDILTALAIIGLLLVCSASIWIQRFTVRDGLPVLNRTFAFEPRVFARLRWAFKSREILEKGRQKFGNQPFRLARGDHDFVILPPEFISELNRLPAHVVNSRISHASSLLGHLNGMDVVMKTDLHVKMLLQRVTPALSELKSPTGQRIAESMLERFPRDTHSWTTIKPLNNVVHCVSRSVALFMFGAPVCDNPELVKLCYEHTENIFALSFIMRLVPSFLQPILVWLLPYKWHMRASWKKLESFVVEEIRRRSGQGQCSASSDLISWMIEELKGSSEVDPDLLTKLLGSIIAGGTYSTATAVTGVLIDLVNHPQFLDDIREEIQRTHQECGGNWDLTTFNKLDKLDSAMKETMRLAPGALLVYSRVMTRDRTLSNGLNLRKGQRIGISGHARSTDPATFPEPQRYDALRAYNKDLQAHRRASFRHLDEEDFRWGAGRWACPGRYIANLTGKMLLVKLLDEYDFRFLEGKRPHNSVLHEFVFFEPSTRIQARRREVNSGIRY